MSWADALTHLLDRHDRDVVATMIGVSERTVYRWEAGETEPSRPTQQLLMILVDKEKR